MKRSMVFEGVAVTLLILLAFLMLAMVMGGGPENKASVVSDISYTYVGSDNVLYILSKGNIQAIDASGKQAWNFSIPDGMEAIENCMPLHISNDGTYYTSQPVPVVSSGDGILYVGLKPTYSPVNSNAMNGTIMAISGNGRILWELPIDSYALADSYLSSNNGPDRVYGDVAIKTSNERVYIFHDFNETVVASNGTVLWNVANISDPASVDEDGNVYMVKKRALMYTDSATYGLAPLTFPQPSATIDAYYPNGTLFWENYTGNWIQRQYMEIYSIRQPVEAYGLPIYHDGLIYAPTDSGIVAFYHNGTIKWSKAYGKDDLKLQYPADLYQKPGWFIDQMTVAKLSLYGAMPFDPQGNVYLQYENVGALPSYHEMLLITLSPDGTEVSRQQISQYSYWYANDGVGYSIDSSHMGLYRASNITDLGNRTLNAYDIKSGKELWSYAFDTKDPIVTVIDRINVQKILGGYEAQEAIENSQSTTSDAQNTIESWDSLDIKLRNDTIYANFQSYNHEYPIVLGKSKLAYVGGIYEFSRNGSLLWYKPVRAQNYFMQVTSNGTVFYQTPDGRIGVTNAGFAAGFTITAFLYLFLRFLCLGAVARAKARLDKNDNRNRIFEFVVKNPGSTLYEVARGSGVNLGTVRYHLFILGMNHKIVASNADGKYIRYFTNSNSYSREQQLVLSLLRRDTMGKILGLIARKSGMSNVEIAASVGMPESITSRYLKELAEKGVVKNSSPGRERAYSIEEAYSGHVADAIKRLQGQ